MVLAEDECSVISRGGSAARAAIPEGGVRVPGAGARLRPLSAESFHLAGEVLHRLQKCSTIGEWDNARESRLGHGLDYAIRIVGLCV
jgi:hypothetical protein